MRSLADLLPPEFAAQIHPDLRKNEAEYWTVRDGLLGQYRGQWVGFADGAVVASGKSAVEVLHAAQKTGRHPFVTCVGHENEPDRIRLTTFPYDATGSKEPMPFIDVEFCRASGMPGLVLDRVIPDTGADASALPWADCQRLQLNPAVGVFGVLGGFGGGYKGTIVFDIWVNLDGHEYKCRLHADLSGGERILGRDVLNRLEVLFRGPANEVVVNP
jgi:Family of unknown function (DUF5678)